MKNFNTFENSQHSLEEMIDNLQVFSLQEVQLLAEQGYSVIPLVEKIEQRETAGSLYERLRGQDPSFLMESAEIDEKQGRYSFIGLEPEAVIRLEKEGMFVNGEQRDFEDPYKFVGDLVASRKVAPVEGLPPMFGGAAGLFGYDLVRYREPSIGPVKEDKLGLPEMALIIPGITIAFDHYKQEVSIIKNLAVDEDMNEDVIALAYQDSVSDIQLVKQNILAPTKLSTAAQPQYKKLDFGSNMSPDEFKLAVIKGRGHAEAGDTYQVVPSQRFTSNCSVDRDFAHEVMKPLKRLNPSRYAFLFEFGDFEVVGCSPEMLVKVTESNVEHMAIAGTRKRGENKKEDKALADELQSDPKEVAEHRMLVDLSRNDVSKVCESSSVEVGVHAAVENYSHVMHMTSKVIGRLRTGQTALDALASISPAGTLSGAPKIRAMQIIDEIEPDKRGPYGGAVGYLNFKGDLDSCIFIRSIVVDKRGFVHVQAGAGVVADSVPESELRETVIKAAAPLRAIEELCNPSPRHQELLNDSQRSPTVRARRLAAVVPKRVLLLDNYDSYTYNLRNYLEMAGVKVDVLRSDVSSKELINARPDFLVVSPGPGRPEDAGMSIEAMRYFPEKGIPSLGVCLGHQALTLAFGGEVIRHKPMHGKLSDISHDARTIFQGLPQPLKVMRYHSLITSSPLPDGLVRSAFATEDNKAVVMAIRHQELPAEGVQFHPESFYTQAGQKIIDNFLGYNRDK